MKSDEIPTNTSAHAICCDIAALAGVEWTETASLRAATIGPCELDRLDPFFDSLGAWDADQREVLVDVERCKRKCLAMSAEALIETVAAHFCAKAVVHLGIHPRTGKQYVGWNLPEEQFGAENYPLKPSHRFCDPLVRQQELFTQIFTYLYLIDRNAPEELAAFRRLSQGHCGLYALNYCGSQDACLIHRLLVRDWQDEADADPANAADNARQIFGWLTREAPVEKTDLVNLDE